MGLGQVVPQRSKEAFGWGRLADREYATSRKITDSAQAPKFIAWDGSVAGGDMIYRLEVKIGRIQTQPGYIGSHYRRRYALMGKPLS